MAWQRGTNDQYCASKRSHADRASDYCARIALAKNLGALMLRF
jgi:hypothetical protein